MRHTIYYMLKVALAVCAVLIIFSVRYSAPLVIKAESNIYPQTRLTLQTELIELNNIAQISAGGKSTCGVTYSGGAYCWGHNFSGQLGDGTTTDRSLPVSVLGLGDGVQSVTVGGDHACALLTNGRVQCWGKNNYGQLGSGTVSSQYIPIEVANIGNDIAKVEAGQDHTCAINTSGNMKCWGKNTSGQLGNGTNVSTSNAVNVSGLTTGVEDIALGTSHTCALLNTSTVQCWGANNFGQLGNGNNSSTTLPQAVQWDSNSVVRDVYAGAFYTCTTTQGNTVHCWGNNHYGQLGDGTTTDRNIPEQVTDLSGDNVRDLSGGLYHQCALIDNSYVKCWGLNRSGQLGDGTTDTRSAPVTVSGSSDSDITMIVGGGFHSCLLHSAGRVRCWGDNDVGQLGDGSPSIYPTPTDVIGISSALSVGTGYEHTCALSIGDGIECWGSNNDNQVGDGTSINRNVPADVVNLTSAVSQIAVGLYHACALTNSGGLKCWGFNQTGQLGDGTNVSRGHAADVSELTSGVVEVTAGRGHTCALIDNSTVKCWGSKTENGTTTDNTVPTTIIELSNDITAISAGYNHTCAINSAGKILCWGNNAYGQLGDGTTDSRHVPQYISDTSAEFIAVSAGTNFTCAIEQSGPVSCWGNNSSGQLGSGTTASSTIPIQVVDLNMNSAQISAAANHACSLTDTGNVKCWGLNRSGQLGDATTIDRLVPTSVSSLNGNVSAISTKGFHSCATMSDGRIKCWGWGGPGQLGTGRLHLSSLPIPVLTTPKCQMISLSYTGNGSTLDVTPANSMGCDSGKYIVGESVVLTATPDRGWRVNAWQGTGAANGNATQVTTTIATTTTITVEYVIDTSATELELPKSPPTGWDIGVWSQVSSLRVTDGCAVFWGWIVDSEQSRTECDELTIPESDVWNDQIKWVHVSCIDRPITVELWRDGGFVGPKWSHTFCSHLAGNSPTCYTLSDNHSGSGSSITVSPNSSSGCAVNSYIEGEQLTLSASPNSGWSVQNWSGTNNDSSISSSNMLTMPNRNHAVTVTYKQNCYPLALTKTGNGSVPIATPGRSTICNTGEYVLGESISLAATPEANWTVTSWSGTDNDASTATSNSLTMPDMAAAVSVIYAEEPATCYKLTLEYMGEGSSPTVSPPKSSDCSEALEFVSGEAVSLMAAPSSGWRVANWFGVDSNESRSTSNALMMPAQAHTAGVVYEQEPIECYQLSLTHSGSGTNPLPSPQSSTGCETGEYVVGESISFSATPLESWGVVNWSGTDNDASASTTNSLRMPATNHLVSVAYQPLPVVCYTLALATEGSGRIPDVVPSKSLACTEPFTYVPGALLTLDATPNDNWSVDGWRGTDDDASTSLRNTVTMPAQNHAATVIYVEQPATCFSLTGDSEGNGEAPVISPIKSQSCEENEFIAGEIISLTARSADGWEISEWLGTENDADATVENRLVMPANDHIVSAIYREKPIKSDSGDFYEDDNDCANYRDISPNGELQFRNFHRPADEDWVRFPSKKGYTYLIQIDVPDTSQADVILELHNKCGDAPDETQGYTFSPGVRMTFEALEDGPVYLRLLNSQPTVAGDDVAYTISVRSLNEAVKPGALILVAGSIRENDPVQENIYNVTESVYDLFISKGYNNERIQYLAPDLDRENVDLLASQVNLRASIIDWAIDHVGADRALTLYMMDHGSPDKFYLDRLRGESFTPADLNSWLAELEEAVPGIKINVIIDACFSGSFIAGEQSIVGEDRVVITSTDDTNLAWASEDGAIFSDHFLAALQRNESLYNAYREGQIASQIAHPYQRAYINGDGNTRPGQIDDGAQAAGRGFTVGGTLSDEYNWPPHIFSVTSPIVDADGNGVLRAEVKDNEGVDRVWAVIYPPSYVPPTDGDSLVQEENLGITSINLIDNGNDQFSVNDTFNERGTYRIVVYAEDEMGVDARPVSVEFEVAGSETSNTEDEGNHEFLYLPLMLVSHGINAHVP